MAGKNKGVVINGIRFRPAEVIWEDAHGVSGEGLPDFEQMRNGAEMIGAVITTIGLVAKIGKYILVVTEKDESLETFDYTLIPIRPKTQVRYS
jgi:hypothetical protein